MSLFNFKHAGGFRCPACGGGWCQKWTTKSRLTYRLYLFVAGLACVESAIIAVAYYCHQ